MERKAMPVYLLLLLMECDTSIGYSQAVAALSKGVQHPVGRRGNGNLSFPFMPLPTEGLGLHPVWPKAERLIILIISNPAFMLVRGASRMQARSLKCTSTCCARGVTASAAGWDRHEKGPNRSEQLNRSSGRHPLQLNSRGWLLHPSPCSRFG